MAISPALGTGTDFVWVTGETRTNVSLVTSSGGHDIQVIETGPSIAPDKQNELLNKIESLAYPGDWWVLAGSLPPGVPDSYYAQIIQVLNAHGAPSLLDSSGEALRLGCRARPFLVKPNTEEACALGASSHPTRRNFDWKPSFLKSSWARR